MSPQEAWEVLGIAPTADERAIKRAYSGLLKAIDVDRDPEAFIRLRSAMETAKAWTTWDDAYDGWEPDEDDWEPDKAGGEEDGGQEDGQTIVRLPLDFDFGQVFGGGAADQYFTGYRPSLPFLEDDDLAMLCARLDRLLFAQDGDEAEIKEQIGRTGRELLKCPALQQVDAALVVEGWLAAAMTAAVPRSDPLSVPAINHFGWKGGAGWSRPHAVEAVLARYDDRVWLIGPAADAHPQALAELTRPPRTKTGWRGLGLFELGKAKKVATFLDVVRRDHATVETDLDQASVAWWDAYRAGRRPPANFWFLLLAVPPALLVVLLALVFETEVPTIGDAGLLALYGACVALTLASIAARSELRVRAKARQLGALTPAELGWAPLLLVLPFAVWAWVVAGPGPLAGQGGFVEGFVFGGIAIGAGIWGWTKSGLHETGHVDEGKRRRGFPMIAALASLFAVSAMPGVHGALAPLPLAVLCAIGWQGYDAMAEVSSRLTARQWTGGVAGLLVAHAAVGAVLVLTLPGTVVPAMLAVPVLVIAQHWLLAGRSRELGPIEFGVRLAAVIVFFTHDLWSGKSFALGGFAAMSAYGLGLSAASLIAAWRQER